MPSSRPDDFEPLEKLRGRVDLVVEAAEGNTANSCRYSASRWAACGRRTRPFSIVAVGAGMRIPCGPEAGNGTAANEAA
jgi:hypothetical protein